MGIMDLFRPKWKSSDPEIRLKAVQEMGQRDGERLRDIAADDPDNRVRVVAIGKITEEDFLQDVAFGAEDEAVMIAARERLNTIYRHSIFEAPDTRTRQDILEKIDEQAVLLEIACNIDDPDIRQAACEKIENPALLCRVAASNCGLKTGQFIVKQLTEASLLEDVVRNASNKKIRKQAQEKLNAILGITGKSRTDARTLEQAEKLCRRVENLKVGDSPLPIRLQLVEILAEWESFDPEAVQSVQARYDAAHDRIEKELVHAEKAARVRLELERICAGAEALAPSSGGNMDALVAEWQATEISLVPISEADRFQARFDRALRQFEQARAFLEREKKAQQEAEEARLAEESRRLEKSRLLESLCNEAEKLAAGSVGPDAERQWNTLRQSWDRSFFDAPETRSLQVRYDAALETFETLKKTLEKERQAAAEAQEKQLVALCETVEKICGDEENRAGQEQAVRNAQQTWKEVGNLVPEAREKLSARFQAACDTFFTAMREHREKLDWERWANLELKQELCQVAETLADSDEIENIAPVVREAQKKWKEIGPVSRDKSEEIWKRFNMACDRVFHRCLARKTALYEELQAVLAPRSDEQIPADFNWTAASEAVREIQARWNAVGSLPLALEKELRDNFNSACNRFFKNLRVFYQQRDAERDENLKAKIALCEAAEALSGSEDWSAAAEKFKEFQQQWKGIGPVPREESDAVWIRFRTACDSFFNRIKAQEPENLRLKEILCEKVEALVDGLTDKSDMEAVSRELIEIQRQWKEIGPVPHEQADIIWQRFRKPCDEFFERRRAGLEAREDEQARNQELKEALVVQAEELSVSTDWKTTADILKNLQKEWKNIGPAPRKTEQELWERFRTACDRFFERRKEVFGEMEQQRLENLRKKERLCISLEVLSRLVLPEDALEGVDHGVQTAEHLSVGLEYRNEVVVPGNPKETWARAVRKVQDIQKTWKTIGPVPHDQDRELWQRYRNAADLFFSRSASGNPATDSE